MLNTPSGTPASVMISGSSAADAGVHSAGFSTTVQPEASAGATFHDSSMNGVFHGVMRPATPDGLRSTYPSWPGWLKASSCWATITSAKYRKFSAARAACPLAWVTGSPVSNVSSSAISVPRASIPSAIRLRIFARWRAARCGHGPVSNAIRAAVTAWSTSWRPPAAHRAYTWLDTGSATPNVAPSALGTYRPPMKCKI
jgi:hypothetical protein